MTAAANLETWRNNTAARVMIRRVDGRGNRVDELIAGHKSFSITPEERRLNQDAASSREFDSFSNGSLIPVRLIEGEEDAAEIASNPNLLGDSDLKALFKTKGDAFVDRVAGIANPVTLLRLREMAEEIDATVGQAKAIEARIAAVTPSFAGEATDAGGGAVRTSAPEGRIRAVTPR